MLYTQGISSNKLQVSSLEDTISAYNHVHGLCADAQAEQGFACHIDCFHLFVFLNFNKLSSISNKYQIMLQLTLGQVGSSFLLQ